jgi:hypothetical protein
VSTLLHATVYMFLHNFLNVLVQIANKMGLQKKLHINFFSNLFNYLIMLYNDSWHNHFQEQKLSNISYIFKMNSIHNAFDKNKSLSLSLPSMHDVNKMQSIVCPNNTVLGSSVEKLNFAT